MLKNIKDHPQYNKTIHWIKLISITGSTQLIVQAVGFASGIMIIRLLPIQEYALYTLANTMLGTMTVLADGGVTTGVMSQGAKVWQNKEKLGAVLNTGLALRRKFAFISLIIATPILFYLLHNNGASWLVTSLIVVSLIPAFFAALSDSLLEIVPKLHQDISALQKNQLIVSLGRLVLVGLTMFIFPWAFIAILAGSIPRIYGNLKLKIIATKFIDSNQSVDAEVHKEILIIVKRTLPGAIYFCFSSQITIWLISIFGNATAVAQLGALGRLTVLLGLISVIINTLIVPRFARLVPHRKNLFKRALYTFLSVFFISVIIIFLALSFPVQILSILGNSYGTLSNEMIISVVIGCVNLGISVFISFSSSRGWIINPYLMMVLNIIGTVFPLFFVDVSTLNGVLLLSLYSSVWGILIYGGYTFRKILQL